MSTKRSYHVGCGLRFGRVGGRTRGTGSRAGAHGGRVRGDARVGGKWGVGRGSRVGRLVRVVLEDTGGHGGGWCRAGGRVGRVGQVKTGGARV